MTAPKREPAERRFFLFSAIAMTLVVAIGFSRTFFLRSLFPAAQQFAAPEPIFLLHGAVFTLWMAWLISQALLIRKHRIAVHRAMGWIGIGIALAIVCLGIYGATVAANRPGGFIGAPVPPEQFIAIPFTAMLFFGTMVALAVAYRQQPQYHKRFMLLATVNLLEAAFIRFPFDFVLTYAPLSSFGPALLFIVALGIYDRRTTGHIHRATLWGGIAITLSLPVAFLLSATEPWLRFSTWLLGGT